MFAAPQCSSGRYDRRAAPLKGSAIFIAEAVAQRLFTEEVLASLLRQWTRFNLLSNTSAIDYIVAFSKKLLYSPLRFSITTTSFSLFEDAKWAINLDTVDPFDHRLMARLLAQSNDLFDVVTRHGASSFKFNDLLASHIKRKRLVKLLLKHIIAQFPKQQTSVVDVVECVLRDLK